MSCPELIEQKYIQKAAVLGKQKECIVDPGTWGWFLHCEYGIVVLAPNANEAFEVHGEIFRRYQKLRFNRLGYPISDETIAADGWGRYNQFEKGYIFWSPATGAWEVKGDIFYKWKSLGRETGFLRYPTSNQLKSGPTWDGLSDYNDFQNGSIYHHPKPGIGAVEVHGDIRTYWISKGREQSEFGFPRTDEQTPIFNSDARFNVFDRYELYWHPRVGTQRAIGALNDSNYFGEDIPVGNQQQNPENANQMLQIVKDKKNHLSHYRRKIAVMALQEVVSGHSGEDAADRYNAEILGINQAWCSEFVRWVFGKCMDFDNKTIATLLWSLMTNVSHCRDFFKGIRHLHKIQNKLWYSKNVIRPDTAQVGDYIALSNGNHSAIIVAVSFDKQWIHTAEGNVGDRTYFRHHRFFHKNDGYQLNSEIYGIGKIHRKLFSNIVSEEYY